MIATAIATILIGLASARVWGTERPSNVAELAAVGGQDEDAFLKQAAKDRLRAEREQVIAEIRGEILYDPAKVEQAGKLIGNRPADTQSDNIDRFLAAFALVETKFQGPYKLYRDALAQTDPDKAAATFAKAADAARLVLNSDDHTNLGAAGRYLYAAALKMAGRPIPAVEAFNKLAYDMPQRISFAAAATMEAARLYEALGRNIYAMDMYNYCLANYGLTLEPSQAKQIAGRVAELKALYDDPMKTLAGGMDQVHNRLTQFDTGKGTQDKEKQIAMVLRDIIQTTEEQESANPPPPDPNAKPQPAPDPRDDPAPGPIQGIRPGPPPRIATTPASVSLPPLAEIARPCNPGQIHDATLSDGLWHKLPPREQDRIHALATKVMSERYRDIVSEYTVRIANSR
jgi:tetratricopeptide (TPR) repeat protein